MRWKMIASLALPHFKDLEHVILSSHSNVYDPIKYYGRPYFLWAHGLAETNGDGDTSCFWPSVSSYNDHYHYNHDNLNKYKKQFVEQLSPDIAYETIIYETGQVPTRKNNWHDFFNMLCWKSFPKTKSLLNHLQYRDGTLSQWKHRSPTQNFCTHLDESGVLVFCQKGHNTLTQLLRDMKWKELFWYRQQDCMEHMRFIVFGHAIYEKFLHPYVGLTGKAIIFDHDCPDLLFASSKTESESTDWEYLNLIDEMVHARLTDEVEQKTGDPQLLYPLPLLGVPGWWEDQDESFYDNNQYFRTTRRRKR